jgi:hypothetical protein
MVGEVPGQGDPLIPQPSLTLPALRQAVAAVAPGRLPEMLERLASWCDEARFVGQYDGLDTVAEAELGQYPPDVDLDRAFG